VAEAEQLELGSGEFELPHVFVALGRRHGRLVEAGVPASHRPDAEQVGQGDGGDGDERRQVGEHRRYSLRERLGEVLSRCAARNWSISARIRLSSASSAGAGAGWLLIPRIMSHIIRPIATGQARIARL
jgi:hypothetical protein